MTVSSAQRRKCALREWSHFAELRRYEQSSHDKSSPRPEWFDRPELLPKKPPRRPT